MKHILFLFAGCALFCLSCNDDSAINNLLGTTAAAPVYTGYKVVSDHQIDFCFSSSVSVLSARYQPEVEIESASTGKVVSVITKDSFSGGEKFIADILVGDANGNTLSILVPFRTRNGNIPKMLINEIRTVYSSPRTEFIEFKTLSDGNIGAIRLFVMGANAVEPVYEFPAANVKEGEYIVLHMRTLAGDRAIDELGDNLNLAASQAAGDAIATARDLWIPGKVILHNTDAIYLLDQDDRVIDGVLLCENGTTWKKNAVFTKAAEFLAKQGKWKNRTGLLVRTPEASDAIPTIGATATRTVNRYRGADTNTLADWYVRDKTNHTPGSANTESLPITP